MITFKKKLTDGNLMAEAREALEERKISFDTITPEQADQVSKVNSKSLVLTSFKKTPQGTFEIVVKDKEFYAYTKKLLEDYFGMTITDANKKERTYTAETSHLGIALDIIEVLGIKYNLSIVEEQ